MPSNITKAFKNKSALRKMADGGRPGMLARAANPELQPLTPAQQARNVNTIGNFMIDMIPGSGVADAMGYLPNIQDGSMRPSLRTNLRNGAYGAAGLQALAAAGDASLVGGVGLKLATKAAKGAHRAMTGGAVANGMEAGYGAGENYRMPHMADGGRRGLSPDIMDRVNDRISALRTPDGIAEFNARQGALNSGIVASMDEQNNVPLLTGRPDLKTDPSAPALTPSLTPMPAGAMIAQGQAAQNNVMLDGMRMGLRTGDNVSFDYYNRNLQNNLSSPSAMSGVLPGQSPVQPTLPPAVTPAATDAPATPPLSLSAMAEQYNQNPNPSLGIEPIEPIAPWAQEAADWLGEQGYTELTGAGRNRSANPAASLAQANKILRSPRPGPNRAPREGVLGKLFGERGPDRGLRNGGKVEGPGGPTDDEVGPVMLSRKEYVLPADTAEAIGYENLDAIRAATHTPVKEKKGLRGMANGGMFYINPQGQVVGQQSTSRALAIPQQPGIPIQYPNSQRGMVPMPQPAPMGGGGGVGAVPPQPAAPGGGGAGTVPPSGTVGYNPQQPAAAPRSGLRGLGLGLGIGAATEGMIGMNDYRTLRDAGEEGVIAPQVVAEGLSRVGGAALGAKAGAMVPIPHPVGRAVAAGVGGLAGYAAPDVIAGMVGHETARSRARGIRNQNALDMQNSGALDDGTPKADPQAGGFQPSQMTYTDGTPYLADPGRALRGRGETPTIPSNARGINQRFDALAEELRGIHGSRVTTPFGSRTLDRSQELLDLEKARALALSGDQNAMIDQRGQDLDSYDAAAGRAATSASSRKDESASVLREMREANKAAREQADKAQETLWTDIERMTGDNEAYPPSELFRHATHTEGFMDQYANATPSERRQLLVRMRDTVAEKRARELRADRLGVAHEPGLVEPQNLQRGVAWGDMTAGKATLGDWVFGNLRGRQYANYGNMLLPLDHIAEQNPDMRGLSNAEILRRIGAGN